MLILEAENIRKYYSDRLIIGFDNLKIYSGDKIGVIGQNGAGKTTLLNILAREIEPDEGFVRQYCEIKYIRQFSDEHIDADPKVLKEFSVQDKINQQKLSGGERTRLIIAGAFSRDPVLLLADEPTTNLDYKGIELLKQKLSQVESFLLISHDRYLLDSLCNRILEVRDGKIRVFDGNYSSYKEQMRIEFLSKEQEYEKYVAEKAHLEEAIKNRQGKSRTMKKAPRRMGNSEARLHRRSATEKQEKINNAVNSLKTRLEKLEAREKPKELPVIKLDFSLTNPPENKTVISAEGLTFCYGSNKILDNVSFKVYNGLKTAIRGDNGAGKTTLLNLIYQKFKRSGGESGILHGEFSESQNESAITQAIVDDSIYIVPRAKIGYFHQNFENLDYNKSVLENVMDGSVQSQTVARTILARLLIAGDEVYKKVGVLSGGERIKVSFAKLFVSDANVLLLDEPTNYLDMMSIEALQDVLAGYEGTVLFVSHDSVFTDAVADRLLILENGRVTEFEGKLKEYEISMKKPSAAVKSETEKLILQMRLTEIISKLSMPGSDKEALEEEYRRLLEQLKQF